MIQKPDKAMQQGQKREWMQLLLKPILLAFFLVSLLFVIKWSRSAHLENILDLQLEIPWLIAAFASQGIVTILFIAAWEMNLRIHFKRSLGLGNALAMIGYNSVGKYTPGKVMGLLARGAALYSLTSNKALVIQTALIEQLAVVHSGIILLLVSGAMKLDNWTILAAALVFCAASAPAVAASPNLLFRLLRLLIRKKAPDTPPDETFTRCYLAVLPVLLVQWVVSAITLFAIIKAFDLVVEMPFQDVMWATAAAYLAGFLAFFTLAGLGVREGIMAGALAGLAGLELAIYISVVHRLITLVYDVLLGLYAFFRTSSLPTESN